MMIKRYIIRLVEKWGYLVLTPPAKKSVYFNQDGEKYGVFKR